MVYAEADPKIQRRAEPATPDRGRPYVHQTRVTVGQTTYRWRTEVDE